MNALLLLVALIQVFLDETESVGSFCLRRVRLVVPKEGLPDKNCRDKRTSTKLSTKKKNVILKDPPPSAGRLKNLLSCSTNEMLRCAQHDNLPFFNILLTWCEPDPEPPVTPHSGQAGF
jgi:hypothetical protein